jgi:AsmA protein
MKCRRIYWLGLSVPILLLLVPLSLWLLLVLVAPTGWAKRHVVAALAKKSGRSVQLDDLRVCFTGGIEVSGLKIGAPAAVADPWLSARRVAIDVGPLELFFGKFEPSTLSVEGAHLRLLRRGDGSLEIADLVAPPRSAAGHDARPHRCGLCKLNAKIHESQVVVIDLPTSTNLTFDNVEGEAIWEEDNSQQVTLAGQMNQGPFQFTVHLDRSGTQPGFEGEFRTSDVVLDQGMNLLRYVVPVLAGTCRQLRGRMDLDVYLRGRGSSAAQLGKSLIGHGNLVLDPAELDKTPLVDACRRVMELPESDRSGSVHSNFVVENGRIRTDHLTLSAGRAELLLSGWTTMDGKLDYQVKLQGMPEHLNDKAQKLLGGLDLDLGSLTSLRLSGNVNQVDISYNGGAKDGRPVLERLLGPEDRDRLRVLGRQFRDKLLR